MLGYSVVSIIHQTLTGSTGSLTCVCDLFAYMYTQTVPVHWTTALEVHTALLDYLHWSTQRKLFMTSWTTSPQTTSWNDLNWKEVCHKCDLVSIPPEYVYPLSLLVRSYKSVFYFMLTCLKYFHSTQRQNQLTSLLFFSLPLQES